MPGLPRRFRRPRAELRMDPNEPTPPEAKSGGVLRLQVELLPMEPFRVSCGRLELALLTTRFSRTVLDGYLEYTSEEVFQTAVLCGSAVASPGKALLYSAGLPLPYPPPAPTDSRPMRRQWQARARFEIEGYRELRETRFLPDESLRQGGAPVVDGRGFLPLYEFRTDTTL